MKRRFLLEGTVKSLSTYLLKHCKSETVCVLSVVARVIVLKTVLLPMVAKQSN